MDVLNSSVLWNVINHLPYFIFWKDAELIFRGCNRNFASQFGFESVDDVVGKRDEHFPWSAGLREKYREDDLAVISSRSPRLNFEEVQRQDSGEDKTVLVSKVPMFGENDKVIGVLGMYTDITHIKELEATKRENDINRERVKSLKKLASVIAHELRTPIASIRMGAMAMERILPKVVEENSEATPAEEDFINELPERIINQVNYCNTFIDIQLKNIGFNRVSAATFTVNSIRQVVEESIENYPFQGYEDELVSYTGDDFTFTGEPVLMRHVIWNLLKNALFFVAKAGKGTITIWSETDGVHNRLHFKDTAIGVPDDVREQIFEGFYSQRSGGTGLGLAFCYDVMKAFGGSIRCESEVGEFTEFILSFPVRRTE